MHWRSLLAKTSVAATDDYVLAWATLGGATHIGSFLFPKASKEGDITKVSAYKDLLMYTNLKRHTVRIRTLLQIIAYVVIFWQGQNKMECFPLACLYSITLMFLRKDKSLSEKGTLKKELQSYKV